MAEYASCSRIISWGRQAKASVVDQKNNLWIAKFPSSNDTLKTLEHGNGC